MQGDDPYDDEFEDDEELFNKTDSGQKRRLDAEESPGIVSPGTEMKMRLTNRENSDDDDMAQWKEMLDGGEEEKKPETQEQEEEEALCNEVYVWGGKFVES